MITLGQAKYRLSRKPAWRGMASGILTDYINEACEILSDLSRPKDSLDRLTITSYDSTITLPLTHSACVGVITNTEPLPIYNGWVEFVMSGYGREIESDLSICSKVIDLGDKYRCFREPIDIHEDGCRLKVYTDAASGVEETESIIEFMGLDADGDVVRTSDADNIRNGEAVTLLGATGSVTTTESFGKLTQVIKPTTQGVITVYAIDPDDSSEHLIAKYEPNERFPNYRRYKVPDSDDDPYLVYALCRARYVEVESDNDVLCVDSFGALVSAMLYIHYRDESDGDRANQNLQEAQKLVTAQAAKYRPAGQYPNMVLDMDGLDKTWQGY